MSINPDTLRRINFLSSQIEKINDDLALFPDHIETITSHKSVPDTKNGGHKIHTSTKPKRHVSVTSVIIEVQPAKPSFFDRGRRATVKRICKTYRGMDAVVVQAIISELKRQRVEYELELEGLCPCAVLNT